MKEALLVEPDLPGWALDQLAADPDDYIAMLAQSRRPSPPSDT